MSTTRSGGARATSILAVLTALAVALAPSSGAHGAVHVVVSGGAISVQQAIDAAAEGDTILLKGGKHGLFHVVGKSLTLVAEKDETVVIDWFTPPLGNAKRSRIAALAQGQAVTIRGIHGPYEVVDCLGEVRLEDCRIAGYPGKCDPFAGSGYDAFPGFIVSNSHRVSVTRGEIRATPGGVSALPLACCTLGAPGLIATNATVALYQATLKGTDQIFPPAPTCAGAGPLEGGTFLQFDVATIGPRDVAATSPLRRGQLGSLHLASAPGDAVLLFTSVAPAFQPVPPYPGVLLGLPFLGVFPIGVLPAPAIDIPIAFSDIPSAGVAGVDLQIQAAFLPTTGLPVIGPMTVITLLDPTL